MKSKLITVATMAAILTISACDYIPSCLTQEGKDSLICLNKNPEFEDASVVKFCAAADGETVTVSYEGVTKTVTKHVVDLKTLQELCPDTYTGCVFLPTNDIYISDKVGCVAIASHELAHVFGVEGVDRPEVRQLR